MGLRKVSADQSKCQIRTMLTPMVWIIYDLSDCLKQSDRFTYLNSNKMHRYPSRRQPEVK